MSTKFRYFYWLSNFKVYLKIEIRGTYLVYVLSLKNIRYMKTFDTDRGYNVYTSIFSWKTITITLFHPVDYFDNIKNIQLLPHDLFRPIINTFDLCLLFF